MTQEPSATMTKKTMNTTAPMHRRRPFHAMAAAVLLALPSNTALVTNTASSRAATRQFFSSSRMTASVKSSENTHDFEFVPATQTQSTIEESTLTARMVMDERQEFELNLGKAVDTLKQDYPELLTDAPDYSIYHQDLEVVDPAGVKLHGLKNYKNAFRLVHTVINLFYCPERSILTFRLVYDWARNNIRVSWNAEVVPKAIFGGTKTTLHVDGISVYVLDKASGKIVQHRVEHLMINDNLVAPKRGIVHELRKEIPDADCIPAFCDGNQRGYDGGGGVVKFQQTNPFLQFLSPDQSSKSSLFSSPSAMANDNESNSGIDWEAYERKNASRKKFGLDPLTPEEFMELESQVQQMGKQQRQRAANAASSYPEKKTEPNFFEKLLGNVLEDTCESNFDCQRPQICCDFKFKKMCCTSGVMVGHEDGSVRRGDRAMVPVVAGYPPDAAPGNDIPRNY